MDDAAEVGIRGGTQIGTDLATARSAPILIQPTPDPPSWVFRRMLLGSLYGVEGGAWEGGV